MSTEDKREGQDDDVKSPATEDAAKTPDSDIEDAEVVSEDTGGTDSGETVSDEGEPIATDPGAEPVEEDATPDTEEATAAEEPAAEPVTPAEKSGAGAGVLSTVFGGALAALVGFGAAQFVDVDWLGMTGLGRDPVAGALDAQTAEIAALRERLAEVEASSVGAVEELIGGVAGDLTGSFSTVTGSVEGLSGSVDGMGARVSETLDRVEGTVGGAEEQFAAVSEALGTVEGRLAGIGDQLISVEDRLAEVDARLVEVEKRPLVESSETAKAAFEVYERELEGLRSSLESQQQQASDMEETMTEMLATARAQMTAVQEEAQAQLRDVRNQSDDRVAAIREEAAARVAEAEANAEARAAQAVADAALAQVAAALNAGVPFEGALPALQSLTEVPAVLTENAAEGIPTLAQLQESFPPLAREALTASITATMGDDPGSRFSAFLRTQTGVRSLEAREGDDPDAVLSRMGVAVEEGDLETALSEYGALPEAGQAVLADWADDAGARVAVDAVLPDLSASLKSN